MHFLSTLFGYYIVRRGASFYYIDFLKNSYTQVSNLGLAALDSSLKNLKSLINLSMNFLYFFKDFFSTFKTYLRAVIWLLRKGFKFDFYNLDPLFSQLLFNRAELPFLIAIFKKIATWKFQIRASLLWDLPSKTWRVWQICHWILSIF